MQMYYASLHIIICDIILYDDDLISRVLYETNTRVPYTILTDTAKAVRVLHIYSIFGTQK